MRELIVGLDCITSKQHTKIYAQTARISHLCSKAHVLYKPGSTRPFAYFIAKGWTVPDYYNYPNFGLHTLIVHTLFRILCC